MINLYLLVLCCSSFAESTDLTVNNDCWDKGVWYNNYQITDKDGLCRCYRGDIICAQESNILAFGDGEDFTGGSELSLPLRIQTRQESTGCIVDGRWFANEQEFAMNGVMCKCHGRDHLCNIVISSAKKHFNKLLVAAVCALTSMEYWSLRLLVW